MTPMADESTALSRVRVRLTGYGDVPSDDVLSELVSTVADRLRLRVGSADLPDMAWSVVVDATVKAVQRRFYEGEASESEGQDGTMSTSWVDDILSEYADEVSGIRDLARESGALASLRFL